MSKNVKYCTVCGEPMIKRPQAIYCSAACQQKAQRNRYKERNENMVTKTVMLNGGIIEKDKKIQELSIQLDILQDKKQNIIDKFREDSSVLYNQIKKINDDVDVSLTAITAEKNISKKELMIIANQKEIVRIKAILKIIELKLSKMQNETDEITNEIHPLIQEQQKLYKQ